MDDATAARLLGVSVDADRSEIRRAYHERIRRAHPDLGGDPAGDAAADLNRAYEHLVGRTAGDEPPGSCPPPAPETSPAAPDPAAFGDRLVRSAEDRIILAGGSDVTFRRVFDAAHDVGTISYVDRSGPILEVLCRFVGEPATSLLLTFAPHAGGTEIRAAAESIEDRPGPPVAAILDLLETALRHRLGPPGRSARRDG